MDHKFNLIKPRWVCLLVGCRLCRQIPVQATVGASVGAQDLAVAVGLKGVIKQEFGDALVADAVWS
jgi:hypothetical protein